MVSIIVAVAQNGIIGDRNSLLWHISEDMRFFRRTTSGHPVIMGRKTFESFPKGALPGRRNIVVTRNISYTAPGIETASSVDDAVKMCEGAERAFIIGGGEIYRQALPVADCIELTLIDAERPDADTRFPDIDLGRLCVSAPEFDRGDPKTGVRYCFLTLSNNNI